MKDISSPGEDKAARQRVILSTAWFTVPGAFALIALAYWALPPLVHMEDASARLMLAARWLVVALLPYAAVCLWIVVARLIEGAHNPLLESESERLKVHCRVMQNTLEQLAWFAICLLALCTYIASEQARIIPILCTFFAFARFVYWWGYLRSGTLGRAPGVQLTVSLNVALLVVTCLRLAQHILSEAG